MQIHLRPLSMPLTVCSPIYCLRNHPTCPPTLLAVEQSWLKLMPASGVVNPRVRVPAVSSETKPVNKPSLIFRFLT